MKFSFLEGGVGWARSLFADLIGHWEKRNLEALDNYDPSHIDQELLADLSRRYGGKVVAGRDYVRAHELSRARAGDPSDDFSKCAISSKEDFRQLFLQPFFFGCEADDPVTASAFDTVRNPMSARINAIYGSDIGHFDVPDMREVTAEAYEPVERGAMTEEDFRAFVFSNPIKLWTSLNPDFFKGTVVDDAVLRYIAQV
jgi:hypothetical protein